MSLKSSIKRWLIKRGLDSDRHLRDAAKHREVEEEKETLDPALDRHVLLHLTDRTRHPKIVEIIVHIIVKWQMPLKCHCNQLLHGSIAVQTICILMMKNKRIYKSSTSKISLMSSVSLCCNSFDDDLIQIFILHVACSSHFQFSSSRSISIDQDIPNDQWGSAFDWTKHDFRTKSSTKKFKPSSSWLSGIPWCSSCTRWSSFNSNWEAALVFDNFQDVLNIISSNTAVFRPTFDLESVHLPIPKIPRT